MERVFGTLAAPAAAGAAPGRDEHEGGGERVAARVFLPDYNARFGSRRRSPAAPSSPMPARRWPRSCACRRSARSVTTTACTGKRALQIPPHGIATTSSRRRSGCTNIRTAGSRSSMGRAAWPATIPHGRCWSSIAAQAPPNRSAGAPVDLWTTPGVAHNPTGATAAADI